MDPHNLQSFKNYKEAEDLYFSLMAQGYDDQDLMPYQRQVEALRQVYETERHLYQTAQVPIEPICNIIQRPERSLTQIAPLISNRDDEIFVFDFDDTLAARYGMLWNNGLRRYDPSKQDDDFAPMPGFDALVTALRNNNNYFMIVSSRNPDGVAELNQYLSQFGVPVYAVGTREADGTETPKGEWILNLMNANPNYTKWNFVDDMAENIESVRDVVSRNCPRSLTLNLFHVYGIQEFGQGLSMNLRAQYQEEYFSRFD
jgi:hypothetical protein